MEKIIRPAPSLGDGLIDYSPKDKPWNVHRAQTDGVSAIYASSTEFEKYAARTADCSGLLRFAWSSPDRETGEVGLKLREARFCRVRHCPVCQWRRSLLWKFRFYQELPNLMAENPDARFLFLTLTVRNCPVSELAATLKAMNNAWGRLVKRPEFGPVIGWLRTTEVTRGAMYDDRTGEDIPKKKLHKVPRAHRQPKDPQAAHPHFHCLLMVQPSYFNGKNYVKQSRWVELWRECARLDYDPVVDIRTVKGGLRGSLAELLKYSVKPEDMLVGDGEWFLEMTRQTHRKRFVASGGLLKDMLKDSGDETNEDLILADDPGQGDDDGARIAFSWETLKKQYARSRRFDVAGSN